MTAAREPESGPASSFDGFVATQSAALLRLAWTLTGEGPLAEDLVQASLERLWTRWAQVQNKTEPGLYTRRVMMSIFLTWRRRRWWAERSTASLDDVSPPTPDATEPFLLRATLLDALGRLPRQQRAAVALRYLDDCTERQTADVLGCSIGTVKRHATRGLNALRHDEHLTELWPRRLEGDITR